MAKSTANYGLKKFENGDPPDLPSLAASMDKIDTELKKNETNIGSLVERGSNANGEYVKFSDGTMICTKIMSLPSTAMTQAYGAIFIAGSNTYWTYPLPFIATPNVFIDPQSYHFELIYRNDTSTTGAGFRPGSYVSRTSAGAVSCMAIGRWK